MNYSINGEKIREIRKEQLGLTQKEMAEILQIEQTTLSAIELNKFEPNINVALKIFNMLNYAQKKEIVDYIMNLQSECSIIRKTCIYGIAL